MQQAHCDKCGYDLTGLPRRSRCPECGQPFDRFSGLGIANPSAAKRADWLARRLRTVFFLVAAGCVLICSGLLSRVATRPATAWGLGGLVVAVLVLGAITSYLYERQE